MKRHLELLISAMLLVGLLIPFSSQAAEDEIDNALIERGRYIAIAADCVACHRQSTEKGIPFAGGYVMTLPMGKVIVPNITPSPWFGIGGYTEMQFADAVRKGVARDGKNLYPAMPYTAYSAITDDDIHALYTYFMHGLKPAEISPVGQNTIKFPFNIRALMLPWNLLYRHDKPFEREAARSEQLNRGKYLVEVLGHCGTCHTPRNIMMAEEHKQNLAGASLGGWYAPNITPHRSGIANWSEHDLVTYLRTGHLAGKAQAAGPMAEAVENSFRFMTDSDLSAIAAWIKQVPAMATPVAVISSQRPPLTDINRIITGQDESQTSLSQHVETTGVALYENACASCHGHAGQGTADNFYPSLTHNSTVSAPGPQNLIMTIVNGIHRKGNDSDVSMPAFADQMDNAQIASVSRYVRLQFAGIDDKLSEQGVQVLRQGGEPPFIMRYLNALMAGAIIIVLLLLFGLIKWRKR